MIIRTLPSFHLLVTFYSLFYNSILPFPALQTLSCNLGLHSSFVRGKRNSSKMPIFRVETKLACASLAHFFLLLGTIKTGVKDREEPRGQILRYPGRAEWRDYGSLLEYGGLFPYTHIRLNPLPTVTDSPHHMYWCSWITATNPLGPSIFNTKFTKPNAAGTSRALPTTT